MDAASQVYLAQRLRHTKKGNHRIVVIAFSIYIIRCSILRSVLHLFSLLLFRLDIIAESLVEGSELLFVEAAQCLAQTFVVDGNLLMNLIRI